jgi:hypothetical protein
MKEIKISFAYDRILFDLGGEVFYLPKDKIFLLLNRDRVDREFEGVTNPDDLVDDMNRWEVVAEYLFWKSRGSSIEQTAKSLTDPVSPGKLKNWLLRSADFIESVQREKAADIKALISRFELEYRPDRRERDLR